MDVETMEVHWALLLIDPCRRPRYQQILKLSGPHGETGTMLLIKTEHDDCVAFMHEQNDTGPLSNGAVAIICLNATNRSKREINIPLRTSSRDKLTLAFEFLSVLMWHLSAAVRVTADFINSASGCLVMIRLFPLVTFFFPSVCV